jgi:hypothetical protein
LSSLVSSCTTDILHPQLLSFIANIYRPAKQAI